MKIFVVSTGRCGTFFMAQVMQRLTAIPSFHEPEPWCADEVVEEVNGEYAVSQEVDKTLKDKVAQVGLDSRRGMYFESNQMFIKSYWERILDAFDDVYGVYLWRNPLDVTISYYKKFQHQESGWFLESHWPRNHLRTEARLPFYENAMWQCLEVKERWLATRHRFVDTFEFDFRKLDDVDEWKRFFERLKIPHKDFDRMPPVKRNESRVLIEDNEALELLRQNWDKPKGQITTADREYMRREKYIEWGKRQIALTRAEIKT
jgi:hypothetical protein